MKHFFFIIPFLLYFNTLSGQSNNQYIFTSDIDNFWTAYDQITSTKDSVLQVEYLNEFFLKKGTPGLKALMETKNYTAKSYINAINNYPLFWKSIRPNTFKTKSLAKEITAEIQKFKAIYPDLKPARIYFTIGALKTGGTTQKDKVLIGSEITTGDQSTITSEFPKNLEHLTIFFASNPINQAVFTNVHEYVHTQQKTTIGNNLLAQCVLEGAAELIAVQVTQQKSSLPALAYGRLNEQIIKQKFSTELFNPFTGYWLYSNAENEFKIRDLGYYVGYAICEKYYNQAKDKKKAIKEMIELDYNNEAELESFVQKSGYFSTSMQTIKTQFENNRPTVVGIKELKNKVSNVSADLKLLTIQFSAPMDKRFRNFEPGPLGESNIMSVQNFIGFSEDGRSVTITVALKPGRQYQLVLGDQFRSADHISLKPYLIDFKTAGQD